jgi:hypothetical protein
MKAYFLLALLFIWLIYAVAHATDYNIGICSDECTFHSAAPLPANWNDTVTFTFNGSSPTGYEVEIYGHIGAYCSGYHCRLQRFYVLPTSAALDGVPMVSNGSGLWIYTGSLAPGNHVLTVSGISQGTLYSAMYWSASVSPYTPPPPVCYPENNPPC